MTKKIPLHWHVDRGLSLGGVDGSNGTFHSIKDSQYGQLLEVIREDLSNAKDEIYESMVLSYEQPDREGLHDDFGRLLNVEATLIDIGNFLIHEKQEGVAEGDPDRGILPWRDRVFDYVCGSFPLAVAHNTSLFVWLCRAGDSCDHWGEEE